MNVSKAGLKEVELLDAMCGTGKTYNLFKFVAANPDERYLYVTPMLSEAVDRPKQELAKFPGCEVFFEEPTGTGFRTKGDHILKLLHEGKNVSCTHALYVGLGKAGAAPIAKGEYIVMWDEEVSLIGALNDSALAREDRSALFEDGVISVAPDGRVIWNDKGWGEGNSVFADVRSMAERGVVYCTKDRSFSNVQVPIELVQASKRLIVSTYLFEGGILHAFLKVKGISHRNFEFEGKELRDQMPLKAALRDRIELFETPKATDKLLSGLSVPIDDLAAKRKSYVFSWGSYSKMKKSDVSSLGKYFRNTARKMGATPHNLIYTLPGDIAGKRGDNWVTTGGKTLKVQGFSPKNCFLHKGARATNDFVHKTAAIHAYNRFPHPAVVSYLKENGVDIDQDMFALAEMIQWFFRTAIRVPNGPKVKLHIVSPRMAFLFKTWLNS